MNLLTDSLPTQLRVDGVVYDIDYDYRNILKIYEIWSDDELMTSEKAELTLEYLYDKIPDDHQLAYDKALLFLDLGNEPVTDVESGPKDKPKKVNAKLYDFKKDSKYIFMAVDRVLNGKLSKGEPVHWWLFMMAFMEMPENSMMCKIITLRSQKAKGTLNKEQKKTYIEMYDILSLDDKAEQRTIEQKTSADEFWRKFNNGE